MGGCYLYFLGSTNRDPISTKLKKHTYVYYVCLSYVRILPAKKTLASSRKITFVVPLQDKLNPASICFLAPKSHLSDILWRFWNIMMLFKGPLSYQEDNWFSFSLNFIHAQFKIHSRWIKISQICNGLKIHFRKLTNTDARKGMFSMYQGILQICLSLYWWICDFPSINTFSTLAADLTYFS